MILRVALGVLLAAAISTSAAAQAVEWRTVAPDNLLVIETTKGRILVELEPRAAPLAVERVRTLASQGFYDGLKFHRVISGFMAQTGDPLGTGAGGSDLPDVPGEFGFRRGRDAPVGVVTGAGYERFGLTGLMGALPIVTQPDAQMMVTADQKVDAAGLFCPGVAGMARSQSPDSANSQFFLMMAKNDRLNGTYTPFGRVVSGLEVVSALKAGPEAQDGAVGADADLMTRARVASNLPEADRPTVQVAVPGSAAFEAAVAAARARTGFDICAIQPVVRVE